MGIESGIENYLENQDYLAAKKAFSELIQPELVFWCMIMSGIL